MWTEGGQIAHLAFVGVRGGGGKGGGGGSSAPTVAPSYVDPVNGQVFYSPQELNDEITQRQAQEKATTATDKQTATDTSAADEAAFQTRKGTAYNDALGAVTRAFQLQGVDPNTYMQSDIVPALTRQQNTIQDLDPNPAAAYPASFGDTLLGNLTSGKRSQATSSLNSLFTPNYANSLIPDTTDDPYIDTILNEQFDPLSSQLQNAQKRGTLTDVGYNAALSTLAQKRSAARDTVSSLGSGLITTDRGGINDLISGARSTASGIGLNDTFDPSTYGTQAQSKANDYLTNFGGALRNAVGGTKFADLTELINAGGAVQGANNPTAANPAGAAPFVDPNDITNKNRGLGNTGAF
jgi:hypothetical protein